jgi:hypothetical protein
MLRVATRTSQPTQVKGTQLRVRSQVIQFRLPVINGVMIWNRPVAVLVRTSDGQEQILSVPDLTRTAVLIFAGLSFASMFLLILYRHRKVEY